MQYRAIKKLKLTFSEKKLKTQGLPTSNRDWKFENNEIESHVTHFQHDFFGSFFF